MRLGLQAQGLSIFQWRRKAQVAYCGRVALGVSGLPLSWSKSGSFASIKQEYYSSERSNLSQTPHFPLKHP
jgi:hypothetical protein